MRKTNAAKSTKTLSKQDDSNRNHGHYSDQDYLMPQDMAIVSNLQRLLHMEIATREESYQELLGMINHLRETKKSKIPAKYQKLTNKKFFSPHKVISPKQNQTSMKNASQVSFPVQNREDPKTIHKIQLVEKELSTLKAKVNELTIFTNDFNSSTAELSILKTDLLEQHNSLRRDIVSHCNRTIEKQNKEIMKFVSQKIRMEASILEECTRVMKEKLAGVELSLESFQQNVERQIKIVNQNIAETKETIEQTFYGDTRSKEKVHSTVSIELTDFTNGKKTPPLLEKIGFVEKRVEGLERRMGLVYEQFLEKPLDWSPKSRQWQ